MSEVEVSSVCGGGIKRAPILFYVEASVVRISDTEPLECLATHLNLDAGVCLGKHATAWQIQ